MKRYLNLIAGTIFVLCLAAFAAGCHGEGTGAAAELESGGDDGGVIEEMEMTAIILADGRRGIALSFSEAIPESIPEASASKADASTLTRSQVEALMSVDGAQINSVNWSPDGKYASVFGEFPYCASLTLRILEFMPDGSDFVATVDMPKNPKDINGDCIADVPIYDKLPGMIYVFEGSEAMDLSVPKPSQLSLADIDPADYWSFQMSIEGDRGVINLGDLCSAGLGVFAAADTKFHQLHIWEGLDSTEELAIWNFKLGDLGASIAQPISIGDMNGDGKFDFAFGDLLVDGNGDLVIDPDSGKPISAYYYVLGGIDLSAYDYGWRAASFSYVPDDFSGIKGQCGGAFGNFNGDISAAGFPLDDVAVCFKYTSYQEILIAFGSEGLSGVSDLNSSSIINVSGHSIGDIAGGDLDGNGADDVAVAMYNQVLGENEVRLFLNEKEAAENVGDRSASASSATIADEYGGAYQDIEVNSPGDINGDGFDDLVYFSMTMDEYGKSYAMMYLFFGRQQWPEELSTAEADIVIQGLYAMPDTQFKAIGYFGDLDNDGYDELALYADNFGASYVYIYKGRDLMKGALDFENDPSAIISFSTK